MAHECVIQVIFELFKGIIEYSFEKYPKWSGIVALLSYIVSVVSLSIFGQFTLLEALLLGLPVGIMLVSVIFLLIKVAEKLNKSG